MQSKKQTLEKVLHVFYGNYAGDNMNVKMAMRKAKKLGIEVKTVVANDDCASAPKTELKKDVGLPVKF